MHSHRHLLAAAGVRALARLTALLALAALPVSAEIIGVEQFDYPENTALGTQSGGSFWDWKNTTPTGHTGIKSNWDYIGFGGPAYISGGRLLTNGHGWVKREYNGNTETNGAINTINVAKTLFARVTVTTGASLPSYFGFASYDFASERFFLGKRTTGSFGYEIIGGASENGSASPPVNSTFTLVMQLDFAIGTIRLFKNPRLDLPMTDALNDAPDVQVANTFYSGTHWSTALRLASGDGGDPILWDDLVVATTWEDLGAVVTTTADEDNGSLSPAAGGGAGLSLREAVKYSPHGIITFAPALSGQTITLTHADGDMEIPGTLTIDASALPGGLTVSGNNTSRHFFVDSGKSHTLRGLTLTRGNAVPGGSISNAGSLVAIDCSIMDNTSAGFGGGLYLSSGTATLSRCTLSGNTALSGGAIWQQDGATVTLSHCTVSGNRSTGGSSAGGIVAISGTLNLQHCTISQNTGNGAGGGLFLQTGATVNVTTSIIAGNTDPAGNRPDIRNSNGGGTLNRSGINLVGNNTQSETLFPAGSPNGNGDYIGTAAAPVNPKLSPLGSFGGPVQTMHPLIGSPAIDAAGTTPPGGTDARGFPRFVNGDPASSGTQLDIGAVEAGPLSPVNNAAGDSSSGTLRSRIAAVTEPGTRITFSPALAGQTILLGGTQLDIPATPGLFIDASNLTAPVTISGNNQSRVFNIPATATVAMHSLRIVNGQPPNFQRGGGISNQGTCTVLSSTLSGNSANDGGGIFNEGTCSVLSSTLSGNSGYGGGGGILNFGTCSVLSSTLSGNSANLHSGGGILSNGTCTVLSSTLSGNSAQTRGGGILKSDGSTFHLTSTIVSGNTASSDANVAGSPTTSTNNITTGDPLLAPLGDYGGPTQTMPPRPGSPAIDAATATTAQTDQRGFPRSRDGDGNGTAAPDIGAVEAGLIAVTIPGDSGPGSLRAALTEAAAQPGPDVIFFTAAATPETTPYLTLASEILITDPAGVTLDASDRPTGLVIDAGPGTNRHFRIASGTTATFQRLRLYGGGGTGGETTEVGWGGSIRNQGTLTLRECTITDCTTPANAVGGAILNFDPGVISLERCSLYRNSATAGGGAIHHHSAGLLTLTACTIAHNTAGFEAGAINAVFTSPAVLTHCTITGNAVTQTGANGIGGVRGAPTGFVTVRDSIIAGNTDANFPGTPNINSGFIAPVGTNNLTSGNPNLATLGDYGGPTWTMPPMPGSPAIDAAPASTAATDQRNVARPLDGGVNGGTTRDIGAVEMPLPLTVTTTADQNDTPAGPTLSLREAIRDAPAGATILFDSSFNGQTADRITLGSEIAFTKGLILNASANPGGVAIDGGPGTNRIFYLPAGTGAHLQRLTLTGGNGGGGALPSGPGGAIYCVAATLSLVDCALTGNSSPRWGGAITNTNGTLTLDRCLLNNNSSSNDGGAVNTDTANLTGPATSSTTLTNCTLTNNTATAPGGGLYNNSGRATLLHCTITGNTGQAEFGSGVASHGNNTRTTVQNCLIAGNTNAGDLSFFNAPTNNFVSLGGNLIGSGNATGAFNQLRDATGHTAASLRLAPLADYGGPTQTIALRPGSPARDNAIATPITTDQRGFGIVLGPKDSGAYEAGNFFLENFNVFAQEFLPHTATDPERARTFDFDGDGQTNEAEWLAVTGPATASSVFRVTMDTDGVIRFPTVIGRTYTLQRSDTLAPGSWVHAGYSTPGDGTIRGFDPAFPAPGIARRFYRILVSQ